MVKFGTANTKYLGDVMNAINEIYEKVKSRDPDQPEFHQAVLEVLESLEPVWKHTLNMLLSSKE